MVMILGSTEVKIQAQSDQQKIDEFTKQVKELAQEIKNMPSWKFKLIGQKVALSEGIQIGFPNGLPKSCEVTEDSDNDQKHSYTYTITCIAN